MRLQVPVDIARRMRCHLFKASRREIGGILMGEEVGHQCFRIADFSVDTQSGTSTQFARNADWHDKALTDFFERTGEDYGRFNYLGEWHSHPSFSVMPSSQDISAMQDLVDEPGDTEFAVLLIPRLKWRVKLECSAHLFVRNHSMPTEVVLEFNRNSSRHGL